ncbi:MAG TPA: XRE family transcriptional regulator [Thermoanaerobaculia bacterium]|jgi:transcriptional regulator with XRE-family HTH domain|nr:XRE family transcriptional regulator [Thermoanaerobaculia bacterium]
MDVIERIHLAVKASPHSKKVVAALAGMSPYKLSRLLNGRVKPDLAAIEAVLAAIGKRMEDLYAGSTPTGIRHALRVLTEYVDTHESPRPALATPAAALPRIGPKKRKSRTVTTHDIAANPNAILLDSSETRRSMVPIELWNRGARGGARVIGDSMIEAGIRDGELVFYVPEPDWRAARRKIVVVRVNTAVFLKYYHESNGQKLLVSAKPGLTPMILEPSDDVQLYGVVVLPRAPSLGRTESSSAPRQRR